MLKITKVRKNGIGQELGLEAGDTIVAFDGHACEDELDYLYYCEASEFTMTVRDKRGNGEVILEIEKEEGEDLGLEFEKNTKIRTCHNHCVFCFVDQMPEHMRKSLYVKDDDYTMSFSCGNFVTLTNVTDEQIERIVRLHLSPLYVSVHTMNPTLRCELLRNRFAGKIVEQIDRLCKGGIELHCQAVLVPGKNDGEEFAYTARKLFSYYPRIRDLACVPTGITKYREGLYPISDVDKAYSEKLLDEVAALNKEFGVPFIQPADEYFVKAERPFMASEFYGDFEQIENGIGMTTKFLEEANAALRAWNVQGRYALKRKKKVVVISGVSAGKVNAALLEHCNREIQGLQATVLPVVNTFFGETVTCTGLLTGKDILAALREYHERNGAFDEVILPANTLKEFEDVFLCGMTLQTLQEHVPFAKISVNRDGGYGLVDLLTKDTEE